MLTIWWCPCIESSLVLLEEGVCYDHAFSWQNSISLCPVSFCIPRPNLPVTPGVSWLPTFAFQSPIMKRISFGGVSFKGLVGLHRTVLLQLLQCYSLGNRLGLLSYWMVCLGNKQIILSFFFVCFIFKLYNIVLVLPNIEMNPPQVYLCSPSWTLIPPPSPYPPSGSSQCTSPKHPVLCIEPGLATHFIHDIIHVSMPFSQIIPPSPSPRESKRLFYTSVAL